MGSILGSFSFSPSEIHFDSATIYFLLILPVIATLISIARQIIGLKMIGIFASISATYAFLGIGLIEGSVVAIVILFTVFIVRTFTKKLKIHYIPKISILLTLLTLVLMLIIYAFTNSTHFEISTVNIMSVLFLVFLSDAYLTAEIQSGIKKAFKMYLETLFVSISIFLFLSIPGFKYTLIKFPFIIIIFLPINLLLGRYKWLRLIEIYRFKKIIRDKAKEYA